MKKPSYKWEPSPHTADLAISITSDEKSGLFHAALDGLMGLTELSQSPPDNDEITEYRLNLTVECIEEALVDFLNECIFIMEVEEIIPYGLQSIQIEENTYSLVILCRNVSEAEKKEIGHIKAATYSGLDVIEKDGRFRTNIIFDT